MVRSSKGLKHGTRRKFKRGMREKFTVEKLIKEFKPQTKVIIKIYPSSQTFPSPRYQGLVGTVLARRGKSYIISVKKGNKEKKLIIRPEHLQEMGE